MVAGDARATAPVRWMSTTCFGIGSVCVGLLWHTAQRVSNLGTETSAHTAVDGTRAGAARTASTTRT